MAYQAEIEEGDELTTTVIRDSDSNLPHAIPKNNAFLLSLPRDLHDDTLPFNSAQELQDSDYYSIFSGLIEFKQHLPDQCIVGVLMDTRLLPYLYQSIFADLNYQRSIALRLNDPVHIDSGLPVETISLAFFTKGHDVFSISKIREAYRYCPFCEKTTKDYGGKKHLYHSYGTLQRDVWKHPDIQINPNDPLPDKIVERTADMLSSGRYSDFLAVSADSFQAYADTTSVETDFTELFPIFEPAESGPDPLETSDDSESSDKESVISPGENTLHNDDCEELLPRVPDNSVDLVFLDPPYNIGKDYSDYDDDLDLNDYDVWSREWLRECVRVLKDDGVLIALNLPENLYTHYLYLGQELSLVNWVTWDSMSRPPAGNIMPTNYPILIFSKSESRSTNYTPFDEDDDLTWLLKPENENESNFVYPLDDNYCKRASCISKRNNQGVVSRKQLTDLWTDIFRLKHKNKREDHPTMLPPKLMRRLIWLFTDVEDIVLDPFNGVGTTSVSAAQMGRKYTGFELSKKYTDIAEKKHNQLDEGKDPFDKDVKSISPPDTKNTKYKIPKKKLQLDVKQIAEALGHVPSRAEVKEHSQYNIKYFDDYFDSWSEATKAAKTTGMSETRDDEEQQTLYSYTEDE